MDEDEQHECPKCHTDAHLTDLLGSAYGLGLLLAEREASRKQRTREPKG